MKLRDLSIMEVRILKHLYCQNPNRNYKDRAEAFKYAHGLELTGVDGMKIRLYLISLKGKSNLRQRLSPGVCIPGGTLRFIHSQLKNPTVREDSRQMMPESFKRSFHDAMRRLIGMGLVVGFISGCEFAEGEDGFVAPIPARWKESDGARRMIGATLTPEGFKEARELFLQLAEEED